MPLLLKTIETLIPLQDTEALLNLTLPNLSSLTFLHPLLRFMFQTHRAFIPYMCQALCDR